MTRSQERMYDCGCGKIGIELLANRYGDPDGGPDYWQVRPRTSVIILGFVKQLAGYRRWQAVRWNGEQLSVRPALWAAVMDFCEEE